MRKDSENLLLSAEYDLSTAQHMLETGRFVYVIFMCHLAIEKMLKAIMAEVTGKSPPKTHNLIYLLKSIPLTTPQDFLDFIAKINNASVVTRYPEDFQNLLAAYPEEVAKSYFAVSKKVIEWLRQNEKLKK